MCIHPNGLASSCWQLLCNWLQRDTQWCTKTFCDCFGCWQIASWCPNFGSKFQRTFNVLCFSFVLYFLQVSLLVSGKLASQTSQCLPCKLWATVAICEHNIQSQGGFGYRAFFTIAFTQKQPAIAHRPMWSGSYVYMEEENAWELYNFWDVQM